MHKIGPMLLELASKFYSLSYFDICASSIHIDRFWLMFLCKPGNCSSRKIKGKLLKDHRTTWCLVFFGILVPWLLSWFFVGQVDQVDDLLLVTGIFLGKMSSRLCAEAASKSGNFLHGMYAAIIHWTFPPQLSSWLQDDQINWISKMFFIQNYSFDISHSFPGLSRSVNCVK